MQKKWVKIAICVVPLLAAGSIYAFAASGTTEADANEVTGGGITYRTVKSEPLSADELKELQSAKMAATTPESSTDTGSTPSEQTVDQSVLDAHNPFLVYAPETTSGAGTSDTGAGSGTAGNTTPPAPASPTPHAQFDLAMVKKLELKTNTDHGWLKVEFKQEKGEIKIEGQLASRKFELKGASAQEMMNSLMNSFGLNTALTAALQGKNVTLDGTTLQALTDLKIELTDGSKIEANTQAPNDDEKHNNGLHKGQEKNGDKGNKKDKDNKNGKGKGKDDDDEDDE